MQQIGFFDVEVTDKLMESLDDYSYSQLVNVLMQHFTQEYSKLQFTVEQG